MSYLVWLDLEMTGLDPDTDKIIEIATVVTDDNLEIVAVGPNIVIKQSIDVLENMDNWNTSHHTRSGLVSEVKASEFNEKMAENATLKFLRQYIEEGMSPLCGNTIGQDRRFLCNYMPELANFFHYRNLDVTSLKILANMWRNDLSIQEKNASKHRALDDVYDSITELKFYREHLINTSKK